MKKTIVTLLTILAIVMVCTTYVDDGNVSIKAVNSNVTVGQDVSVTVSFGEKVSIAQFKLSYDKDKLDYQNCSIGEFGPKTNRYVYVDSQDENVLESVTLNFKSKAAGSVTFAISGGVLSGDASISNATAKVIIQGTTTDTKPTSSTTSSKPTTSTTSSKPTTSSTSSKPTTSSTPSTPLNNEEKDDTTDNEIEKNELNDLESILSGLHKEDYTEDSWNKLQEIILAAQNATTVEEYEEIKAGLEINSLEKVSFDKEELKKILKDLLDKSKNDYTEESWNELKELINKAESTDLKSEYDAIKDKLTVDGLILVDNNNDFESFLNENKMIIIITLVAINVILIILSICILVKTKRRNNYRR